MSQVKSDIILPSKKKDKIRYAVVGLGYIAQTAVLPAFRNARKNSKLVALVSGDKEKLKRQAGTQRHGMFAQHRGRQAQLKPHRNEREGNQCVREAREIFPPNSLSTAAAHSPRYR